MIPDIHSLLCRYKTLAISLAEAEAAAGFRLQQEHDMLRMTFLREPSPCVVVLERSDVVVVLQKYLEGTVSEEAIEAWANVMILSDWYEIAPNEPEVRREGLLRILHQLATPRINRPITRTVITEYLESLMSAS